MPRRRCATSPDAPAASPDAPAAGGTSAGEGAARARDGARDVADGLAALGRQLEAVAARLDKLERGVRRLAGSPGPFGVYLGDGEVLTQTLSGLRFCLPAADDVMTPKLVGNRVWEPRVTELLPRLVRRDRDFVDVGANVGYFAVVVAELIGRHGGGEVHAFEPNPRSLALLRRNVGLNWSLAPIHVHALALGDRDGTATLVSPVDRLANASLVAVEGRKAPRGTYAVDVPVRRLDDVLAEPARVGLVKVDVEGGEYRALKGAERLLAGVGDVDLILEWDREAQAHEAAGGAEALAGLLGGLGFRPQLIERELVEVGWDELRDTGYANILASRRPV